MAKVLIVGGGFGGVVAAESLLKKIGSDHEITLVSRSRTFYHLLGLNAAKSSSQDGQDFMRSEVY